MCRLTVLEVHTLIGNPSVQAQISNYTKVGAALGGPCCSPKHKQTAPYQEVALAGGKIVLKVHLTHAHTRPN